MRTCASMHAFPYNHQGLAHMWGPVMCHMMHPSLHHPPFPINIRHSIALTKQTCYAPWLTTSWLRSSSLQTTPSVVTQDYIHLVKDATTKPCWTDSLSNRWCILAQGIYRFKDMDTIFFIRRSEVPNNRKVTYTNMLVDHKPHKTELCHTWLAVRGDHITYPGEVSMDNMGITTSKVMWNSIVSTPRSK
jgi:hypothetical protein